MLPGVGRRRGRRRQPRAVSDHGVRHGRGAGAPAPARHRRRRCALRASAPASGPIAAPVSRLKDVDYGAIYEASRSRWRSCSKRSVSRRGRPAARAKLGGFDESGLPLNTHGVCSPTGIADRRRDGAPGGGTSPADRAGDARARTPRLALPHGDGGVLSSHVTSSLSACDERATSRWLRTGTTGVEAKSLIRRAACENTSAILAAAFVLAGGRIG